LACGSLKWLKDHQAKKFEISLDDDEEKENCTNSSIDGNYNRIFPYL